MRIMVLRTSTGLIWALSNDGKRALGVSCWVVAVNLVCRHVRFARFRLPAHCWPARKGNKRLVADYTSSESSTYFLSRIAALPLINLTLLLIDLLHIKINWPLTDAKPSDLRLHGVTADN